MQLDRALDLVDPDTDPDTYVLALNASAVRDINLGRLEPGLATLQQALATVQLGRTTRTPASLLGNIAVVHLRLGDLDAAARHYDLARRSADEYGEHAVAAIALSNLSEIHLLRGDAEAAAETAREALSGPARDTVEGAARSNLGRALSQLGDYAAARVEHALALEVLRTTGERHIEASVLNNAAETESMAGDAAAATVLYGQAGALAAEIGDTYELARHHDGLAGLAALATAAEDHHLAREHWTAALDLYTALGAPEAEQVRTLLENP